MQYNITINETKSIILNTTKKIDYHYDGSNTMMINDLLFLNLKNCNLNYNNKNILIVGNDKKILDYMNKLLFNDIIMTDDIERVNFNNINCIINITNDIKMSRVLDIKSFQYNIPFFDCSIDNYKFNVHTVIPFITESSSLESIYQEKSYLLCVLTNFPTEYDHTIKWAIDLFDKMNHNINLIKFAYNMFNENYNTKIQSLLNTIEDETWEAKCNKPTPIVFDIDNKDHIVFIFQTIKLFDKTISEKDIIEQLVIDFKESDISYAIKFNKFDNDHLLWIQYAANLRCANYNIVKLTSDDIKYSCGIINIHDESREIAYNLMIVEMIKYFNNYKELYNYKNTSIDLEKKSIEHFTPNPAKEIIIGNIQMNAWAKLIYCKNSTLKEFKEYYEDYFKTTISMILNGSKMLYVEFVESDISRKLLDIVDNGEFITMTTDNEEDLPEIQIKI
jgi:hypothetical protein